MPAVGSLHAETDVVIVPNLIMVFHVEHSL